ncbi:DNA-3-methyladenine glycosylase I [Thiofilum flexile]|uniref:DNA-3-methyladenine glycosylase I n=1 Tax=Thiofilum flexile TaxID=125627 RepID=UPI0006868486|nr:DNA-3-methyladenine glycosylase I [Thiofilum flexile]
MSNSPNSIPNTTIRCAWLNLTKSDYVQYHDEEWGVPVFDDRYLFECLCLEASQAGLSWYTVLVKREAYRQAFDNFDPLKVAQYDTAKIDTLMTNAGLIRHRGKFEALINNARHFLAIQNEFGSFARYLWAFVGNKPEQREIHAPADYRSTSPESEALAKDLKRRGFKFLGATTCYAYMQAVGLVNDHQWDCHCRERIQRLGENGMPSLG